MHRVAFVTAFLPAFANAASPSPCSFTLGHGSVKAESAAQPQRLTPYWFTLSGRAELEIEERTVVAKLYDAAANGDHTHTLTLILASSFPKVTPFKTTVKGSLKTMFSDAGNDALAGTLEVTIDSSAAGKPKLHSLVVHNAYSFVALSCYGKSAA